MKHIKTYDSLLNLFNTKIEVGKLYSYKIKELKLYAVVKCDDIIIDNEKEKFAPYGDEFGMPFLIKNKRFNKKDVMVSGYNITASKLGNKIGQPITQKVKYESLKPANKKEIDFYNKCELEQASTKYNL